MSATLTENPEAWLGEEDKWSSTSTRPNLKTRAVLLDRKVLLNTVQEPKIGKSNLITDWVPFEFLMAYAFDLVKGFQNRIGVDIITSRLGHYNRQRIEVFTNYEDGWDGSGHKLKVGSIATLEKFLGIPALHFHTEPSVFLTRNGNVQIAWEDKDLKEIEIEFFDKNLLEYYREKDGSEGVLNLDRIEDLLKVISFFA